ncbi:putative membrane protein YfcA [Bradyrhizobium sp. AZCC 1578]|uniref:sulfite exporter TauE/SafE family protein n=1 Tax=Bradyrhizobium sp. AZCC 1578 TaxID=3117027 RepID=UPI002FF040E8
MDGATLELPLFLLATFAGAVVSGLSGFAFGLVVSAIWLYILTPLQTATLIIAFGLLVQGYSVWKLRGALDWRRLWPFVAGAALGVPVGVGVLTWANPAHVRAGVGAKGAITQDTIKLFLIGLPALFAGTWAGLKLYGRLDEAAFRKVVLVLLLVSGAVLII